jgi:diguanylate cyclase (GGDEF)-like protein
VESSKEADCAEKRGKAQLENDLFVRIFRKLSAGKDPYRSFEGILRETCEFFCFQCGFVYEPDHLGLYTLRERHHTKCAIEESLPERFSVEALLPPEEQEALALRGGTLLYIDAQSGGASARFLDLFAAKTVVMLSVIFDDEGHTPAAFIGMADKTGKVSLDSRELESAEAVLSVLAGHIKMRVYRRRLEYALESLRNIISENKRNEELVRSLAEQDSLTSLYNRRKFFTDLDARLAQGGEGGYLLFMDLDDFKNINDSLGHLEGDELLCQIGDFLAAHREQLGIPYRYGGDEFIIICEGKTREEALGLMELVVERFRQEWRLSRSRVYCRISIGAAPYPQGDKSVADIIDSADIAMYEVKENGKDGFRLAE